MLTKKTNSHAHASPPYVPIVLVVGVDRNDAIGKNGRLPWHAPADMKIFRHITFHNPVIMGRTTWESLPKPLVHRTNIILSSSLQHNSLSSTDNAPVHIARTPEDALDTARRALSYHNNNHPSIMIIGGSSVYNTFLPLADEIYISRLNLNVTEPDAFFPKSHLDGWFHKQDDFIHQPSTLKEKISFTVRRYLSPKIAAQQENYPRFSSNLLKGFSLDLSPQHKVYSSESDTIPSQEKDPRTPYKITPSKLAWINS